MELVLEVVQSSAEEPYWMNVESHTWRSNILVNMPITAVQSFVGHIIWRAYIFMALFFVVWYNNEILILMNLSLFMV